MRTCSRALLLLCLVSSILSSGCEPKQDFGGKIPAKIPKSLVSLSPGTSELTLYIGGLKLEGRSPVDDYPPQVAQSPIVVTQALKPDYETIMKLKPDVIIYDQDLLSASEAAKLKTSDNQIMEIKGNTVDAYLEDLYRLGSLTLSETSFADYITRVQNEETVCRSEAPKPRPKAALIMSMPNSNPMVAGVRSFYADLIRQAGSDPVGPDAAKFETMTVEALIALNPDVIVVASDSGDYSNLTKDPRMSQLTAVKKGKFFGIPQDYVLRRGARVDKALHNLHAGFLQLAK